MSMSNDAQMKSKEIPEYKPAIMRQLSHVICKNGLILLEGTLVLTKDELKLINVRQVRERIEEEKKLKGTKSGDQLETGNSSPDISIPTGAIESITYEIALGRPSLLLKWQDETRSFGRTRKTQFIQRNDEKNKQQQIVYWIPILVDAKNKEAISEDIGSETESGEVVHEQNHSRAEEKTANIDVKQLESEIIAVLSIKDWKGPFQIASELREVYGKNYDFDQIEGLCKSLAKKKLIEADKVGEFFRKPKAA